MATPAMNINLHSYMENIKNRTLETLQTFYNFSKEHYKHNNQDKKTLLAECHVSEKNMFTNFRVKKKGKTPDKV